MKRLLSSLMALAMMFSFSACSTSANASKTNQLTNNLTQDEKDAKEVVESFLKATKAGEVDSLQDYCTAKYAEENEFEDVADQFSALYEEVSDADVSDELKQSFSDFMKTVFDNLIRDYEIKDVKTKDDTIKVKVSMEGANLDELNSIDFESILEEIQDDFIEKAEEADTPEKQEEVLNEFAKAFFDKIGQTISEMESETLKSTFTLINEDGEWLIDKEVSLNSSLTTSNK